jgi:DNA-binding beta-propeller fold protein YncE
MITKKLLVLIILSVLNISGLNAEVLEKAELILKINLKKAPTSRPQTVAYIPVEKKYYIADGGLAPMGSATEAPISKSLIHTYDETGKYIESTRAGFDNRSIYFNQKEARLETISYNVSSAGGFAPMTGIFSLDLDDNGLLTGKSSSISGFAAAMGSAGTMPSFDSKNNIYYAKQERTNEVFVVDAKTYKLIETIKLDFTKPNVEHHDVASHFVAYTEKKNEELILLDVDHKRFLVYDKKGNYKGESKLPKTLKIRAQNHFNGLGYTLNGYYFLYIDSEGEHGSYHAYKVLN